MLLHISKLMPISSQLPLSGTEEYKFYFYIVQWYSSYNDNQEKKSVLRDFCDLNIVNSLGQYMWFSKRNLLYKFINKRIED